VSWTDVIYTIVVLALILAFVVPLVRAAATIFVPIGVVILLVLFGIDQFNGGPVTAVVIDWLVVFFHTLYVRIANLTHGS
jgi:hypothetical protein